MILATGALIFVLTCVAGGLASNLPNHEITGLPGLMWLTVFLVLSTCYLLGCIKLGRSKGYSGWLMFWLFLAQFPGFIALLLLPDRREKSDA